MAQMGGDAIGMAAFALVGAVTPGPVNLVALRYGVEGGLSRPLAYTVGASLSYGALLWLAGMGAGPLLEHPLLAQLIRWAGAAYLAGLAWQIISAPVDAGDGSAQKPVRKGAWRALLDGGLFQVLNPKAWLVAISGVALVTGAQAGGNSALRLFCLISTLVCCLGVGIWAVAGRLIKAWLAEPRRQRIFNRILGGALGITVAAMLI
jgi:threonine/homoserine/homoserine lactone efflux protein